jgi:hypothetical protein
VTDGTELGTPGPTLFEAARQQALLSNIALWTRYVGLGGKVGLGAMVEYLSGSRELERLEEDILAHALNEAFVDQGLNHPVPYSDSA